jgi:predicted esterase
VPTPPPELTYDVIDRTGAAGKDTADALLVLVHGYAEPPANLTDRLGLIDPGGRCTVVVPHAPFEHRGRPVWHRALVTAPLEAATQFGESLVLLDQLLGRLAARLAAPPDRIVVGGFSQGGGLALGLLLSADVEHRPAAGFGVCSFPPAFPGFRASRDAARGRPFLLSSARQDNFAPIEASRGGAATLAGMGVALTYLETDGEHVMSDEAAAAIGGWLPSVLDGTHVAAPSPHLDGVSTRDGFYDGLWELA